VADVNETNLTHFGLRDFLFYVVPGAMILAAIILSSGFDLETISGHSEVALFAAAVLAAYVLGHIAWGISYPVRRLFGPRITYADGNDEYRDAYMWMIEKHTAFYTAEVFRYDVLSQFVAALVVPVLLFGTVLAVRLWPHSRVGCVVAAIATGLAAVVLVVRYVRYRDVVNDQVMRCWRFPWKTIGVKATLYTLLLW